MDIKQIETFAKALPIIKSLKRAGYEAYFVGGAVRDYLLERAVEDVDITTDARPEEVQALFKRVIPVGLEHGTVIVRMSGISYEVTTFRMFDEEKKEFLFGQSLAKDLQYRDFTMNALAMDEQGQIIDLFEGRKALEQKKIQAVQDADGRLREDPLRMVRACRFVSQLNFTIEEGTLQAIKKCRGQLADVATERLKDEVSTLVTSPYMSKAIDYLVASRLIEEFPVFEQNKNYIKLLQEHKKPFHTFFHMVSYLVYQDSTVSINQWIKKWKGSNEEKHLAHHLYQAVQLYSKYKVHPWLIYHLDESLDEPFVQIIDTIYRVHIGVEKLKEIRSALPIQSRQDLVITGHTLMKWFSDRKPGKWIESMLEEIEKAVIFNEINNHEEEIKEWISCHRLATD